MSKLITQMHKNRQAPPLAADAGICPHLVTGKRSLCCRYRQRVRHQPFHPARAPEWKNQRGLQKEAHRGAVLLGLKPMPANLGRMNRKTRPQIIELPQKALQTMKFIAPHFANGVTQNDIVKALGFDASAVHRCVKYPSGRRFHRKHSQTGTHQSQLPVRPLGHGTTRFTGHRTKSPVRHPQPYFTMKETIHGTQAITFPTDRQGHHPKRRPGTGPLPCRIWRFLPIWKKTRFSKPELSSVVWKRLIFWRPSADSALITIFEKVEKIKGLEIFTEWRMVRTFESLEEFCEAKLGKSLSPACVNCWRTET